MTYMRLKELRDGIGITQQELGVRMGVDCSTVTKWETEVALPKTRQLPLLAQILGVGIDELYTEEARAVRPTAS